MNNNQKKREEIMTQIMNLFSQRFSKHAILCGGMVLRLLDCPRLTNDLDYTFVPYKSKKDIKEDVITALSEIPDSKINYTMNSKCLRVIINKNGVIVQVEAKVATSCATDILTTASLARLYNQTSSVIPVMAYPISLSNKLAAWLERRLIRDLYDIYFYLNLGIKPDENTIKERLKKPQYSKRVKIIPKESSLNTLIDFYDFLKEEVIKITTQDIKSELSDFLSEEDMIGLEMKIKASITSKL